MVNKLEMREWVAALEVAIDLKLSKWKKESRIENGEVTQVEWQFEQTHLILDIFWHDHEETVVLQYMAPRSKHDFTWHGLNERTFDRVMDRVGNLAQMTMYPPIEPHV